MRKGRESRTSCLSLSNSGGCFDVRMIWLLNDAIYEQSNQMNCNACVSAVCIWIKPDACS